MLKYVKVRTIAARCYRLLRHISLLNTLSSFKKWEIMDGISRLVLFLEPGALSPNPLSHVRNLWLAQRAAKYSYHSFMLLDLLDSHVLLWLQTLSGVNGLWAMTMQELAAADIASVRCKPNWLHKTKQKMEALSNIFSWDRNQSLHSNWAAIQSGSSHTGKSSRCVLFSF